jgi:hypothetical protein
LVDTLYCRPVVCQMYQPTCFSQNPNPYPTRATGDGRFYACTDCAEIHLLRARNQAQFVSTHSKTHRLTHPESRSETHYEAPMNFSFSQSLRLPCFAPNPSTRTLFTASRTALAVVLLSASVLGHAQDEKPAAEQTPLVKVTHIMRPSSVSPAGSEETRVHPKLHEVSKTAPRANATGSGIVYTCASNVAAATCNYLNTTVAGYYSSTFTNANAQIYIQYGATGLGESDGYLNLVTYKNYVAALTALPNKSSFQTSALSAINSNAAGPYGSGNVEVSTALGTVLGFSGMHGIVANESTDCTPGASGCYDEVITVADTAMQQSEGFTLYYDNLGGSEPADAYDFYAVVQHETDEVLGTSSCISTQGGNGLSDDCDFAGGNGVPSAVDLSRYSSPGHLALDTAPSTADGQYFSYNGGTDYGAYGSAGDYKVYNTLANGDDFADYVSSSPDCGSNEAVQDATGCPGEDAGLTVINDGESELVILNVVGYSLPASNSAPAVSLSATSLAFGSEKVGTASGSQSVTLTNSGNASLTISSVALTGTNASSFVFANNCVTTLAAGATCTIHGHFTPTTTGALNATITITDNAANSPQTIALSGTGTSSGGGATVSLSATSVAFGNEAVGTESPLQTVTLTNTGSATLTISSIALTGTNASSFLTSNTCGSSVAAGANCSLKLRFDPKASGSATAALTLTDNASNSPQSIALTGTGGSGGSGATVSLSATSVAFGDDTVGSESNLQTVTLTNTGTATLTISSIALTGTNASSFLTSNTCGSSVAAGANCSLKLRFDPKAKGNATAALTLTDNASNSPQSIALTGTGD